MPKPNPKIDHDSPAAKVAALWPSVSAFCRAIDRPRMTVQGWLEKGHFPAEEHPNIVEAARREKMRALKPADFVDARIFARPASGPGSAVAGDTAAA